MADAVTQPYAQPSYTQPCLLWYVCCRDFVLDGDPSPLFQAACGMMKLQHMFGLIPRLQARGAGAGNCAGCAHTCHDDNAIMYLLDVTHVLNSCAPKVVPTGGKGGGYALVAFNATCCRALSTSTRLLQIMPAQVWLLGNSFALTAYLRVSFVGDCCWSLPAEHHVLPEPVHM